MNEPTNNVENLTAELKSVEPKFWLKSKTVWGVIIIALMALAKFLGVNIEDSAGKAGGLLNELGVILALLGIRTKKQPLTFKPKVEYPESYFGLLMIGVMGISMAAVLGLSSCTPPAGGSAPSIATTPDGCLLVGKTELTPSGAVRKYYVGYCSDGRKLVQWTTEDLEGRPVDVRATYRFNGTYELTYNSGGVWLEYDSKSGLAIGRPPEEQGEPVEVESAK